MAFALKSNTTQRLDNTSHNSQNLVDNNGEVKGGKGLSILTAISMVTPLINATKYTTIHLVLDKGQRIFKILLQMLLWDKFLIKLILRASQMEELVNQETSFRILVPVNINNLSHC